MTGVVRERPSVILVSYWSNEEDIVCSDWLQDKVAAFRELGFTVALITSMGSTLESSEGLDVIRVATRYSASTWRLEQARHKNSAADSGIPIITLVFGTALDAAFKILAGNVSWGKWFWGPSAALAIHKKTRELNPDLVFITGGPSGAHFAGLLARMVKRFKLVLEFQDPFIGSQFKASKLAFAVLAVIERLFLKKSDLVVVTSKGSLEAMSRRNPEHSHRIVNVYPGSPSGKSAPMGSEPIRQSPELGLTHFGTLYGSRNFSLILELVQQSKNYPKQSLIRLVNYGHVEAELAETYERLENVVLRQPVPRSEVLNHMASASGLLLIQHQDSRSDETVPFKLYDYTKTSRPIFALIANEELRELLDHDLCFVVSYSDSFDFQLSQFLLFLEAVELGQIASRSSLVTSDQLNVLLNSLLNFQSR